ncbi:hypothetical protein EE612_052203, partial [Oryza sativa]
NNFGQKFPKLPKFPKFR